MSYVSLGPVVSTLKPETICYDGGARTPLMEKFTTLSASTEATPHATSILSSPAPLTNLQDYIDYQPISYKFDISLALAVHLTRRR
jgi:hypothetical protein